MRRTLRSLAAVAMLAPSVLVIAAASALGGYTRPSLAVDDLCGGTGGIGQIVRVDKTAVTIKRSGDTRDQVIHLTRRSVIRTSSGLATPSDLEIGDRVTLVGSPGQDGSFTADTVVVCNRTQELRKQRNGSGDAPSRSTPPTKAEYETVSRALDVTTILVFGSTWVGLVTFLRRKKKIGLVYVLFLSVFSVYLYKVLDFTLLQFQSLLLQQHFVPGLQLNGIPAGRTVNLIPLVTLAPRDATTSLFNVLMMVPFGFGLPFITNLRLKRVVIAALFFSLTVESLQLITGFAANTTFRIADINDVIFNTVGAGIGYALFRVFVRILRGALRDQSVKESPILRYIDQHPQVNEGL
jgi:glycopeptide antibiotics resistance protein